MIQQPANYYKYITTYSSGKMLVEIRPVRVNVVCNDFRDLLAFAKKYFSNDQTGSVTVMPRRILFSSDYKDNKVWAKGFMKDYKDSWIN